MVQPATRADARANRERLLAAAVELFAQKGLAAEMREIAERAGLSVGALYRHFPSKEELIGAVIEAALAAFDEAQAAAFATADPLTALQVFVQRVLGVVECYGEPLTALLQGQIPGESLPLEQRRAEIRARSIALIQRGIDRGVLRADLDPAVAAAMLRVGFVPRTLAELRATRSREQIATAIVDLFIRGAQP